GVERKALGQGRDRVEKAKDELPTPSHDLRPGAEPQPRTRIRYRDGQRVPPADLAPDLGMLRDIGADTLGWDAEGVAQQLAEFGRHRHHRLTGPVGECQDADSIVGSHPDLRVEAGQNPLVLDSGMSAQVAAHESQTHTRYAGISLILALEHG